MVAVKGGGSTWYDDSYLFVGTYSGNGALSITGGASVRCSYGYLGCADGSVALVNVDGATSQWNTSSAVEVGTGSGVAALNVTGGGSVSATRMYITSQSRVSVDVGNGSEVSILEDIYSSDRMILNSGTVRILAGASVAADGTEYSPISAKTWSGDGCYQAVGGTWDATGHTFTASSVTAGSSNVPVSLDRHVVQRTLIRDNGTGGTNWKLARVSRQQERPPT